MWKVLEVYFQTPERAICQVVGQRQGSAAKRESGGIAASLVIPWTSICLTSTFFLAQATAADNHDHESARP